MSTNSHQFPVPSNLVYIGASRETLPATIFHQLATNFAISRQLVELKRARQKLDENWQNWIGNARYGCRKIVQWLTNSHQLATNGRRRKSTNFDDTLDAGQRVTRDRFHVSRDVDRRRGPWGFRLSAGFIRGSDVRLLRKILECHPTTTTRGS